MRKKVIRPLPRRRKPGIRRLLSRPKTFLVWGAGGHGKVVADLVRACGHLVAGFVDADGTKLGMEVESGGARVVIMQEDFLHGVRDGSYPEGIDAVALAIGNNTARERCLLPLYERSIPSLVHPSAVVSPSAELGLGTLVLPTAVINAGALIGDAVIINSGAIVEHDCVVADAVHVSPGAILAGGVQVGQRSWIGAGAVVIQGVVIGADSTVGAGAVLIEDVPDGIVVAGVPAIPIGHE